MEELIPLAAILGFFGVVAFIFYLRHRNRQEVQGTLRLAIEQGHDLSPDLIESLASNIGSPQADLRKGIVALAIGAATFGFAVLVGEEDAVGPLMGLAMFPILVGIAYLLLWVFVGRKKEAAKRTTAATAASPDLQPIVESAVN